MSLFDVIIVCVYLACGYVLGHALLSRFGTLPGVFGFFAGVIAAMALWRGLWWIVGQIEKRIGRKS